MSGKLIVVNKFFQYRHKENESYLSKDKAKYLTKFV